MSHFQNKNTQREIKLRQEFITFNLIKTAIKLNLVAINLNITQLSFNQVKLFLICLLFILDYGKPLNQFFLLGYIETLLPLEILRNVPF